MSESLGIVCTNKKEKEPTIKKSIGKIKKGKEISDKRITSKGHGKTDHPEAAFLRYCYERSCIGESLYVVVFLSLSDSFCY